MQLTPAILTDSFLTLQQQVDAVRFSHLIEAIHIDVIDGQFAENFTVTPLDLTVGDFSPVKLDFHFMAEEPMDLVFEAEAVKDYLPIRRIIAQVERMSHQKDFLWEVKSQGWEPVLALDVFTQLDAIDEEIWPELKHILLMGVEAGFQEQQFHRQVLEKVRELRAFLSPDRLHIAVDGGVKLDNAAEILAAGVNELVVGSQLWTSEEPLQVIEEFYTIST